MRSLIALSLAFALAAIAFPAAAQPAEFTTCVGNGAIVTDRDSSSSAEKDAFNAQIAACALVIQAKLEDGKADPAYHAIGYESRGEAYAALHQFDLATADLDRSQQLVAGGGEFPDFFLGRLSNAYGVVDYELHRYNEAIRRFSDAIDIDHDHSDLAMYYYNRAVIYSASQDYVDAISDYTEAINQNPKFARADYNLGDARGKLNQYNLAAASSFEAAHIDPTLSNSKGYFLLGLPGPNLSPQAQASLYYGLDAAQRKDFKSALTNFLDARKNAPDAPQISLDLGLAESHLDGWELRSIAWFELYLAHAPAAPNTGAVRLQVATLESRYEARLAAILDRMGSVLAATIADDRERQFAPQPGLQFSAEQVRKAVAEVDGRTGSDLAVARQAIGDTTGAVVSPPSDRESFLLDIAVNGIKLDDQFDETQLPDDVRSRMDPQYNDLSSLALSIKNLALAYRKIRGPVREKAAQ